MEPLKIRKHVFHDECEKFPFNNHKEEVVEITTRTEDIKVGKIVSATNNSITIQPETRPVTTYFFNEIIRVSLDVDKNEY